MCRLLSVVVVYDYEFIVTKMLQTGPKNMKEAVYTHTITIILHTSDW